MRFLIVDDNSGMRRLMRSVVKKASDSIFECADGAQAVEAYQKYLPEWVLMDVEMPQKDGLTATREIRAEFPQAKIVIVTTHGSRELREAASQAGAFGFVAKENLLELRGILGRSRLR